MSISIKAPAFFLSAALLFSAAGCANMSGSDVFGSVVGAAGSVLASGKETGADVADKGVDAGMKVGSAAKNVGTKVAKTASAEWKNVREVKDIPPNWIAQNYGRKIAARLAGNPAFGGIVKDKALTRYVNLVGGLCAANASRPGVTYRFAILDSNSFNAFAAPGGYIFITRGALKKLRSEAELAGVLSHEIAHIDRQHTVNEIKNKFTMGAIVKLGVATVNAGVEQASAEIAGEGVGLSNEKIGEIIKHAQYGYNKVYQNSYSSGDENEADLVGMGILQRAGYPADGLISAFKAKAGK